MIPSLPLAHHSLRVRAMAQGAPLARWLGAACVMLAAAAGQAHAQMMPPPVNQVALAASATLEVPQDWLSVTLAATHEGTDAAQVQVQLKRALDTALAAARKQVRPGELEVRSGGFSLQPRYGQQRPNASGAVSTPLIVGWVGTGEIVLEGRDSAAIAQLAGKLQTVQVQRLGFSLSREAREKVEAEVTAQAIQRFRARAADVARQFGFASYQLREVTVSGNDYQPAPPVPFMRAQAMTASADEALPVEAGKTAVTIGVSGSVQLQ